MGRIVGLFSEYKSLAAYSSGKISGMDQTPVQLLFFNGEKIRKRP
jgi:hypothetical protein